MKSTHLEELRKKRQAQYEIDVTAARNLCEQEIAELQKKLDEQFTIDLWPTEMRRNIVITALVGIVGTMLGGGIILLGAIIAAGLIIFYYQNTHVKNIKNSIEECKKIRDNKYITLKQNLNTQNITDIKDYTKNVENAQLKYGNSSVITPIVTWLCDQFLTKIKAADQRQFITHIKADLSYRVDADKIVILEYRPHANYYGESVSYKFYEHSFFNLPDLHHQIGCSLALARLIEFELFNRISSLGHSTEFLNLTQANDDNTVTLSFTAPNPNYIHPVELDRHI